MEKAILILALSLSLVGCGGETQDGGLKRGYSNVSPTEVLSAEELERDGFNNIASALDHSPDFGAPAPEPQQDSPIRNESGEQFIAYTYAFGLTLPQAAVSPVMQTHIDACEAAGPQVCIITNSNLSNRYDDQTSGFLSLRAVPSWVDTFQNELDRTVEDADGEITSRNKQAVDLTRAILDTDARLNAKITLKGRLETLLATRDGELGDLLQIERELARVTGEIESITSNLKALRLRVSMSEMTINYETKRSITPISRTNPLGRAFGDFFYNMSEALAAVITFFAIGLPWMVLFGIFLFIWIRAIWPWVRKRRTSG